MARNRQRRTWTWRPDSASPRVLLECAPQDSPAIIADSVRRAGYDVAVCTGPDDNHPCDLLADGACTLVDEADVVVNLLGNQDGDRIGAHVSSARRPPALVIETGPTSVTRPADVPAQGSVTITKRVTRTQLLASIRDALTRDTQGPPMWGDGCP